MRKTTLKKSKRAVVHAEMNGKEAIFREDIINDAALLPTRGDLLKQRNTSRAQGCINGASGFGEKHSQAAGAHQQDAHDGGIKHSRARPLRYPNVCPPISMSRLIFLDK
jgi:hypothetical protein